jgi:hypothetical protein
MNAEARVQRLINELAQEVLWRKGDGFIFRPQYSLDP